MMTSFPLFAAALLLAAPAVAQSTTPMLTASALAVGTEAPTFKGQDVAGRPVELKQLLKKGPVVLYFYRGQWCPYCNKQLSQLQDSLAAAHGQGGAGSGGDARNAGQRG
ncbi:MAG: redoxin domain-containing protein [Hymenobacter sp.]